MLKDGKLAAHSSSKVSVIIQIVYPSSVFVLCLFFTFHSSSQRHCRAIKQIYRKSWLCVALSADSPANSRGSKVTSGIFVRSHVDRAGRQPDLGGFWAQHWTVFYFQPGIAFIKIPNAEHLTVSELLISSIQRFALCVSIEGYKTVWLT